MLAARVDEDLVYKKFVGNDGRFVTPLQSKTIAESLADWLRGRNLTVTLSERSLLADAGNEAHLGVIRWLTAPRTSVRSSGSWI